MYYKHGLFFPDYFPWPFDSALASLHKAAVVNGVSGRVLLGTYPMKKTQRSSIRGKETQVEKVMGEIYDSSRYFLSCTNVAKQAADYFPSNVKGALRYCEQCLADAGFVPALFSLHFLVNCPWHHQPLKPMCERCQDLRKFMPSPFGSSVGYHCRACGYWVPSRAAIFAACRSRAAGPLILGCHNFLGNVERFARLAALEVLHFDSPIDEAQVLTARSAMQEVLSDDRIKVWHKNIELTGSLTAAASPEEDYRRFVSFHQAYLLSAHCDCSCCALLSRPDVGDLPRSMCIYTAALSLFRQKFEYLNNVQVNPRLSSPATLALVKLAMTPKVARRFFQSVFYQLVARLWFWSGSASRFVVHVDPEHFFEILENDRRSAMLDRLLGERLQGRYRCKFDLPADQASMRRLMGPIHSEQALVMRNFGNRAEFNTVAASTLFFGSLRATAMFYL